MAMWKNDNLLKESKRPMREAKKSYFYGVKPYVMIWHGEWADPEICNEKTGKTMNYYDIEDCLWSDYNDDLENGEFTILEDEDEDSAFERWVKENEYLVASYFGD